MRYEEGEVVLLEGRVMRVYPDGNVEVRIDLLSTGDCITKVFTTAEVLRKFDRSRTEVLD